MTSDNQMVNIYEKIRNIEDRLSLLESKISSQGMKELFYDEIINITSHLKQVKLERKDEKIKKIQNNTQDHSKKEQVNITHAIEKLKDCKTYKNQLNVIKQQRKTLIKTLGIKKYTELCNNNIQQVTDVFLKKGFKGKKLETIIQKSLNSLDSRLTKYGKYYDNCIDIDEINILKETLEIWRKDRRKYEIFSFVELCENLNNYGSVISTIEEIIKKNLVDKNGFNNIIYCEFNEKNNDPYSFYFLDKIIDKVKYWKMDCRLEDFSIQFRDYLIEYLIKNFRNMYRDVFADNDYRADYKSHCQFTECDLGLLYSNILVLSNFTMLNNLIKNVIKLNCFYKRDENDIFNIVKDDPLKDKNYCKNLHIKETEIHNRIFDR